MSEPTYFDFIMLRSFQRQADELLDDDDLQRLEQRLIAYPETGAVIRDTGGMRKLRIPAHGKGARGGARVIYYLRTQRGRVYLVAIYAKNVQEDLTAQERKDFKRLTAIIDEEG
jgi:hypothetical protein